MRALMTQSKSFTRTWCIKCLRSDVAAGLFCVFAFTATTPGNASAAAPQEAPRPLLTRAQGHEIVTTALSLNESASAAQDCSHLVHEIYSAAGFDYPYATSMDLYAGHGNFRRVRHAQPGDLITWRGHVGIVVDPTQHNFYSLVRSGPQSEDYLGPYWRSRGRPRFYRYVLSPGSHVETAKAAAPALHNGQGSFHKDSSASAEVLEESERTDDKQASEAIALRSMVAPTRAPTNSTPESLSSNILISSQQRRPTAAETYDKILELSSQAASVLRTAEPFQTSTPIVIFDELKIDRVETKRDNGWLHLQIESHVRIVGNAVDFKRRREKVRWELLRDSSGWAATPAPGQFYVSRDSAVRELAAQLADMTQSEGPAKHDETVVGQEARIANLLSALLQR